MRPVEICQKGYYGGIDKNNPSEFEKGIFHQFITEGEIENGEGDIECFGLIELEDGSLKCIQTHKMKFLDKGPFKRNCVELIMLKNILTAWDNLPEDHYDPRSVPIWLANRMKPVMVKTRELIYGNDTIETYPPSVSLQEIENAIEESLLKPEIKETFKLTMQSFFRNSSGPTSQKNQ